MTRYFLLLLLVSCTEQAKRPTTPPALPRMYVQVGNPSLHQVNGTWMYQGSPFNGYIMEKQNGTTTARLPVRNGKEDGVALGWFANGVRQFEKAYCNGKRHGTHTTFYPDGKVAGEQHFTADLLDGEQRTYHANGRLWQNLHYVKGYEEGKQRSWNDSGRLVNNFTVKKGKLYGVIGRFDCMSVTKK